MKKNFGGAMFDYTAVCEVCNNWYHYNKEYDAQFCESCDEWVTKKCIDISCKQCKERPDRPSHIYSLKKKDLAYEIS